MLRASFTETLSRPKILRIDPLLSTSTAATTKLVDGLNSDLTPTISLQTSTSAQTTTSKSVGL